jgi:energy-coupling factor transport system permease protein
VHPLIRLHSLLVFILLLALGDGSALPPALLVLALSYAGTGTAHLAGLLGLVRRIRWLLLSILVLYGWWTPGTLLWEGFGSHGPTLEGLRQGGVRVGVLLAIVAAVHWMMSVTGRDDLLGALVRLTAPLRWLGVDHQRLAVRMQLTLEAVPRVQALALRPAPGGNGEGTRLARLAARARGLYGAVLAEAGTVEPGIREVPDTGRVPAWQWTVPVALGLLLWFGGRLWPGS